MVDVDGVLIVHPHIAGWTVNLHRDLGVTVADLQRVFFTPHWDDVVHGRASLRDRLSPVLAEIAPHVAYDSFVEYWFSNDAHLDKRLLNELATFRRAGIEVHLATVQEHERASYLWIEMGLHKSFDGIHYAAALGSSKPAAEFYRSVENAVDIAPESIFFIDDKEVNVATARQCGWTASVWTGHDTVEELIVQQQWSGN